MFDFLSYSPVLYIRKAYHLLTDMKALLYLLVISACSSCLSLEAVQQYATESATGTDALDAIELSFRRLCQTKRQLRDLRQSKLRSTYQDSCLLHQQADSAIRVMQNAVQDYLLVLAAVSADERIYYNFTSTRDALTNSGLVSIEASTADAYQNLLSLLVTASTEAYRRRQVQRLVAQAHQPVTTLINQLTVVVDQSLLQAIQQQRQMLYINTLELADSAQSFVERRSLLKEHNEQVAYYEQQEQLLDNYLAILESINKGHQQLYDQREKLHRQETVATMAYYLQELRKLRSSLDAEETE